jgi:hypothetical protein
MWSKERAVKTHFEDSAVHLVNRAVVLPEFHAAARIFAPPLTKLCIFIASSLVYLIISLLSVAPYV